MDHRVTLTFDNGPWPGVTERVLDLLASCGLRSTFFVVGRNLLRPGARELLQRAVAEGHWIGNHTWSHSIQLGDPAAGEAVFEQEIEQTQRLIGDLSHADRLFRPYGAGGLLSRQLLSSAAVDSLRSGGFTCVLWSSVPRDWEPEVDWVERCLHDATTQTWPLVVLHDLPGCAVERLPELLDRLADREIEVVQELPPDCLPIRRGQVVLPIDDLSA